MKTLFAILVAVAFLAPQESKDYGKRPDWSMTLPGGKKASAADYDKKVVIVDFWATWCPPCRKEIPHFIKLKKDYGEKGLELVCRILSPLIGCEVSCETLELVHQVIGPTTQGLDIRPQDLHREIHASPICLPNVVRMSGGQGLSSCALCMIRRLRRPLDALVRQPGFRY
jgi:thiol-disulfide isomerase/thioredoxin